MATLGTSGLDELRLSMKEIEEIPDDVMDKMLNTQADIVLEAQKREGISQGVRDTGLTLESLRKGKPKRAKGGVKAIRITFHGSVRRGNKSVRFAEIAFVNNYGKKNQKARPFVSDANEKCARQSTEAAANIYYAWLKSKNL